MKLTATAIKNINDDYMNTIYAIMGFMNVYIFELKKDKFEVKVFQGRKLDRTTPLGNYVTPDIGILDSEFTGVIGEVKNNFPKDSKFWMEPFEQLLKYDDTLIGWPNSTEKVKTHDIVLLVHESRSRAVRDFYLKNKDVGIKFKSPFIIIEYGRSDQGKQFFKFRIEEGNLTNAKIHKKFYNQVQYPMEVFVRDYSKVKIYDGEPHLSWMLLCIHQTMIDKATSEGLFVKMKKNTKIAVKTSIDEIVSQLRENYSFKQLQGSYSSRQPEIPKREWVFRAVEKLIQIGEAAWIGTNLINLTYFITRHKTSAKDYYESVAADSAFENNQLAFSFEVEDDDSEDNP